MQQEPAIALALGGRAWTYLSVSASGLGAVATLPVLADSGWALGDAALGALVVGALLYAAGVLVQQQAQKHRRPTP